MRSSRANTGLVPTTHHSGVSPALINSSEARRLAGNISGMTLWRWGRAGVIPPPLRIRGRNYWRRDEFIHSLDAAAARCTP